MLTCKKTIAGKEYQRVKKEKCLLTPRILGDLE